MARLTVATVLFALSLATGTQALPIPHSFRNQGIAVPQRMGISRSEARQPVYVRLDDAVEQPGANPDVLIVSQGHIVTNGRGDDSLSLAAADHHRPTSSPPTRPSKALLNPTRYVHNTIQRLVDGYQQYLREEAAATTDAAAVNKPEVEEPPAPAMVDLRRRDAGHEIHKLMHAHRAMHQQEKRRKIRLYGHNHSPTQTNLEPPKELMMNYDGGRWKDE